MAQAAGVLCHTCGQVGHTCCQCLGGLPGPPSSFQRGFLRSGLRVLLPHGGSSVHMLPRQSPYTKMGLDLARAGLRASSKTQHQALVGKIRRVARRAATRKVVEGRGSPPFPPLC